VSTHITIGPLSPCFKIIYVAYSQCTRHTNLIILDLALVLFYSVQIWRRCSWTPSDDLHQITCPMWWSIGRNWAQLLAIGECKEKTETTRVGGRIEGRQSNNIKRWKRAGNGIPHHNPGELSQGWNGREACAPFTNGRKSWINWFPFDRDHMCMR
jgi:hypothetical protein